MANTSKPKILNVDDYPPALYARTRILRNAGFDVREATNGRAALEAIRNERPDIAILDVNLPDMSGIDVCQEIKKNPETSRVLVLQTSASAISPADRTVALDSGADSYLIEPVEPEELVANIRALLRLRRAESALDESDKVWRAVLAATNDAVLFIDEQYRILSCNQKATELYGYAAQEIGALTLRDLRAPELRAELEPQLVEAARLGGLVYETRHIRKDGSAVAVEVSSKTISTANGTRYIQAIRDISERKRNEELLLFLSEASKLLASSLDVRATLVGVAQLAVPHIADWCIVDLLGDDGQLELVQVAHTDPEKVRWARELRERLPVDLTSPQGLANVIRTGQSLLYPGIPDASPGQGKRANPVSDFELQLPGLKSVIVVPLTTHARTRGAITLGSAESGRRFRLSDLEMAEEFAPRASIAIENAELYQQSQSAIRTRDVFVSVASHELKTPITVIQGYAELLQRLVQQALAGGEPTGEVLTVNRQQLVDRVTRIQSAAERLTRLLDDLLDVNRIQRGALALKPERVELNGLVSGIIQTALMTEHGQPEGHGRGPQIDFQSSCDQIWGNWDPSRLEQVVINLINNAAKYSPRGGRIEITTGLEPTAGTDRQQAHLVVRDHGMGIPTEEQARLFQPFMRASNVVHSNVPGTGLGLTITKEIVERHGGRIWVESGGTEQGAAFHVLLPLEGI